MEWYWSLALIMGGFFALMAAAVFSSLVEPFGALDRR